LQRVETSVGLEQLPFSMLSSIDSPPFTPSTMFSFRRDRDGLTTAARTARTT